MPTADDTETPLPAATPAPEADSTAPQARAFWWLLPLAAVLAALAVWGIARARRTPADTVRAEFRALYKKMCRCGLSEGVSSDQEEFKQFYGNTPKRRLRRMWKRCWRLCRRRSLRRGQSARKPRNRYAACAAYCAKIYTGNCRKICDILQRGK